MKLDELLKAASEKTGVHFAGIMRKHARIRNGIGDKLSDILGWDVIMKEKTGGCYSFYAAQPPLIGMTHPEPVVCPLGIVAFDDYKIKIEEAIKIFHSQDGGSKFTEIHLSWPLVHPAAPEPYWYFRTELGNTVVIGANSGQIKGFPPSVVLYMAQPK